MRSTDLCAVTVLCLFIFPRADAMLSGGEEGPRFPGRQPGQRAVVVLDGTTLAFRWCPPGSFEMGSPQNEWGRAMPDPWEKRHRVTLTSGFWILETEVTQKQFHLVTGRSPSFWKGDNRPVEMIGMPTCVAFCKQFSQKTGLAAMLPSESQWEYACRAGTTSAFHFGSSASDGRMQCRKSGTNVKDQTSGTVEVRSFEPNAWGLYDMHGNVAEWVADRFDPTYYMASPDMDPPGPEAGTNRVLRGGGWSSPASCCRSASRNCDVEPYSCSSSYGFRFIVVPEK